MDKLPLPIPSSARYHGRAVPQPRVGGFRRPSALFCSRCPQLETFSPSGGIHPWGNRRRGTHGSRDTHGCRPPGTTHQAAWSADAFDRPDSFTTSFRARPRTSATASSPFATAGPSMTTRFPSGSLTTRRAVFSGTALPCFFAFTTSATWSRVSEPETRRGPRRPAGRRACRAWRSRPRPGATARRLSTRSRTSAGQLEQPDSPDDGLVADVQFLREPTGGPAVGVHQRLERGALLHRRQVLAEAVLDELVDQDLGSRQRARPP